MQFIAHIQNHLAQKDIVKITLSKPRTKTQDIQNIYARPILLNNELLYQITERTKTQDFTKNLTSIELKNYLKDTLNNLFFNAILISTIEEIQYLQSKKGKEKVIINSTVRKQENLGHNKQKTTQIATTAPYLHALGLTTKTGKIIATGQRKFKQINKYVELLSHLIQEDYPKIAYDMGSGKGYLTFALYDYLQQKESNFEMNGIEIREDLVIKCNTIARQYKMNNLQFEQGSIDNFKINQADMVIALHACDIATDMAIATGLNAKAKYIVVAPCCHKQIRKEMQEKGSDLLPMLQHGIYKERFAEMLTDTIRALLLESKGYETKVFEFISAEHTAKNVMITAKYTGKTNSEALAKINQLKQDFGINTHYLETLV